MHKLLLIPSGSRDLDNLPEHDFKKIKERILNLKNNPRPSGSIKLTGEEGYRLRSGDYRILYRIDDKKKTIFIHTAGIEY